MLDKRVRAGRGGRRIAEWLPNYGRAGSLGDRDTEAHERSLIEIDAKYADVISLDRAHLPGRTSVFVRIRRVSARLIVSTRPAGW